MDGSMNFFVHLFHVIRLNSSLDIFTEVRLILFWLILHQGQGLGNQNFDKASDNHG